MFRVLITSGDPQLDAANSLSYASLSDARDYAQRLVATYAGAERQPACVIWDDEEQVEYSIQYGVCPDCRFRIFPCEQCRAEARARADARREERRAANCQQALDNVARSLEQHVGPVLERQMRADDFTLMRADLADHSKDLHTAILTVKRAMGDYDGDADLMFVARVLERELEEVMAP